MNRHWGLLKRTFGIELAKDMAYKGNFFIKFLALVTLDLVGPLVMLLIYNNTAGLPGWSFEEFILFQGTFTFVFGFGHAFFVMFPANLIAAVRRGSFDRYLLYPFNTLVYFSLSSINIEGFAEMLTGLGLIIWASAKIGISVFSWNFLFYILLILTAFVFQFAIMTLIAAASILFVKSHALMDIFYKLVNFAKYPLDIYGSGINFLLTFIFPLAITAYFPVQVLLKGFDLWIILKVMLPIIAFFLVTVFLWNKAMKKYTSAGG